MMSFLCFGAMIGLIALSGSESVTTSGSSGGEKSEVCPSIKACQTPFPMFQDFMDKYSLKGLFTVSYSVILDHVCSKKAALHTCLNNANCSDVTAQMMGKIFGITVDYVCGDGRAKLLSESRCFARDWVEQGYKDCGRELKNNLDMFNLGFKLKAMTASDICVYFVKYIKCVQDEVKNSCNNDAVDFLSTLTAKKVEPLASLVDCTVIF